jgi:hypothetical protein
MISEITALDVISYCRLVLNIETEGTEINDVFLTSILRRTAGTLCPCPRSTLRAALLESLSFLYDSSEEISSRLEDITNELIVAGDLLELSDVTTGDSEAKGTWVFAAPPAFVERKSGTIFLTGIIPDNDHFLPDSLRNRVSHHYNTRSITVAPGDDVAAALISEGLIQLSEPVWLKAPKMQSADELIKKSIARLSAELPTAPITGLEIIDSAIKPTFYRGRWAPPIKQTGAFVGRRPQEFGMPVWCFAELVKGILVRFIDLPTSINRWRACDAAWHLQMAIDSENGRPQRYRVTEMGGVHRYEFFSPLPLWSERRFMMLGQRCPSDGGLFAYEIPATESTQEEEFLQENLWLRPLDSSNDRRNA